MQPVDLSLAVTWITADNDRFVLALATERGRVQLTADIPASRPSGDRWGNVVLQAQTRADATAFVEAVARWLDVDLGKRRVGKPRPVNGAILVQEYTPGAALTSKLSLEQGDEVAEVYFNVRGQHGELSPKDDVYARPLVACLARGFGVAGGIAAPPAAALDIETLLDQMRHGGDLERWVEGITVERLARVRAAMDLARTSPTPDHSFIRINAAKLLLRLGENDASARFAEGVLDQRRYTSREFLALLARITARAFPALDPQYAAGLDATVLLPALDTILSRYATSTATGDVHDRQLAERVRARLLERL